jgi:hypothetical protein
LQPEFFSIVELQNGHFFVLRAIHDTVAPSAISRSSHVRTNLHGAGKCWSMPHRKQITCAHLHCADNASQCA